LGLVPGGRVLKPVAKGEMMTGEDLGLDTGQFVYRLRQVQDAVLGMVRCGYNLG
jgi:predicted homoserine dehydrogenase-like protein